ncbi:MAG: hypothetical protein AB1758_36530 [Candidatus Eremiobacterota bacterium]
MRTWILFLLLAAVAWAGSETPPKGPPWVRALDQAQAEALQHRRPIFLYFTKTY